MNELQIFSNEQFGEVRTIEENDKILFCAVDVARALGYKDPTNAIKQHCDEDGVAFYHLTDKLGRDQNAKFISEGNVYRLIVHSNLSSAKAFGRWVFDEVLPTIRKHGAYMTKQMLENCLSDPDFAIGLLSSLKEERAARKALEIENAVQNQQIAELRPKASYYDCILQCKDLMSVSKIAKDYGKSAQWLNQKLHELGVQYNQSGVWLLYQKYAEQGYTSTKTHLYTASDGSQHAKTSTQFTQKGRLFIYSLLKEHGILPTIETTSSEKTPA